MAFVTDSNRLQPLWQPPPTACLTASGAASQAPPLLTHPPPPSPPVPHCPSPQPPCPLPVPLQAAAYTYPRPVAPALQQIVGGMLRVDGPQRLGLADVQRTEWYGRGLGRLPQDGPRVQALCQATQAQLRGTDVPSGGSHSTAEDGGA